MTITLFARKNSLFQDIEEYNKEKSREGGGIAIFVRDSLQYKIRYLTINCLDTKSLQVEIVNEYFKNILRVVYRPPDGDLGII